MTKQIPTNKPHHKVGDLLLNITDLPKISLIKLTDKVKDFFYFKVLYSDDPEDKLLLGRRYFNEGSVFSTDSWNIRTGDRTRMFDAIFYWLPRRFK